MLEPCRSSHQCTRLCCPERSRAGVRAGSRSRSSGSPAGR